MKTWYKQLAADLRLGIQLLPYSVQWKLLVGMGAFFLVIGLFFQIATIFFAADSAILAGIYLGTTSMLLPYSLLSTTFGGIAHTSKRYREIQFRVIPEWYVLLGIVLYTLVAALYVIGFFVGMPIREQFVGMLRSFLAMQLIFLLEPLIYRVKLWVYIIFFTGVTGGAGFFSYIFTQAGIIGTDQLTKAPLAVWMLIPYFVIPFTALMSYLLTKRVYRQPISDWILTNTFNRK